MGGAVNRPLLRKELRDQHPFVLIGLALIALDLFEAFTRQIDRQPLGDHFPGLAGPATAFQVLVGFAVGTGLLTREDDEGTLGFLDGLPVTRARLFIVKVFVALGVLLIYPAAHLLLLAVQQIVSRDSLNGNLHAHLLLVALALTAVATFVGLSAGLLLGFLRTLAWLTFGVCAAALAEGIERWPWLSVFDPVALLNARLVGSRWRLPMGALAVQLGLAAACAASALVLFVSAGRRRDFALDKWLRRPLVSALVGAAMIGVAIWVGSLYLDETPEETRKRVLSKSPDTVDFPDAPPGHAVTRHYSFSYPALRSSELRPFLVEGDRTFERVASLLRVETESSIDVDLSGSLPNTEGTAYLDRIRMDAGGFDPLATLAHETTHVFALRMAGGERERELSKMTVFDEGLARWVELRFSGDGTLPERDRFQAAVVSKRSLVRPEMLTDLDRLARSNDENLKYPLGAVFVDAFIRRYGNGAPRQLLSTLARPDFPRDLQGPELWQAAFQLAGFDLAVLFDDYSSRLKSWEREYAAIIDTLPRLRGVLVRRHALVGVHVLLDGPAPEGWKAVVRFRPTSESPLDSYVTLPVVKGVAWQSLRRIANEEVCFQSGLEAMGITLFEGWTCLPLDSADVQP